MKPPQPAPGSASQTSPIPVLEYVWLLVLATLWGSSFSFLKLAVASIPPMTAIALRTLIAGTLIIAFMHWRGMRLPLDRASLMSFLNVSLVNTVAPFMLIAWGLQWVDAGLAVILNSTTPIFAFLFTFFLLGRGPERSQQLTPRRLFGVAAGIAGIVLIVGAEALGGLGRQIMPQLAIVLASTSYAVSALYGGTFRGMSPLAPAAGSLLIGAGLLTPIALIAERPWTASPTGTSIMALVFLGIVCTALGNVLYFRLLGTLGSLGTTAQSYLRVPIGVLAGILLLGEQLTPTAGIGLVCVVAGVAAMTITAPWPGWLLARIRQTRGAAESALFHVVARAPPRTLEYVLLVVLATLWAGSYIWVKVGLETIPPLTLMAGRIGCAGLFLIAVMTIQGKRLPRDAASWRMLAMQGAFASVLPFGLVAWGQQWVDAGPAAILNSVSPMFAFLITWGVTRHEPASGQKLAGVLIGLLGVVVVIGPRGVGGIGTTLLPQLAIVLSSLCYAYAVIYARNFKSADAVVTAAGSMVAATVMMLPAALLVDRPWTLSPSVSGLIAMVGVGVLSTGLGFIIYFRLTRTVGPMAVTAQSYLRAPIGVLLAAALLGEAVTLSMLGGLVLVVIGVAALTLPDRRRRAA